MIMSNLNFIFVLIISVLWFCSNSDAYRRHNSYKDDIFELKRELYERLLEEIEYDYPLEPEVSKKEKIEPDEKLVDYKTFFSAVMPEDSSPKLGSKQKRFLGSLMDMFKSKNKSSSTAASITTTKPSQIKNTNNYGTSTAANQRSETDDAFYKLKQHCKINFDTLCLTKKREMYELVQKCDRLKFENKGKAIEPCKEVISVYCYVYYSRDLFTCFGTDYEQYVPGGKKISVPTTTASTRKIIILTPSPSTKKPVVASSSTTTTTTTKSTTTTTTTTTKKPASSDVASPFDGPVTTVPNDADKLKKIGNYCLKNTKKDANCDKMLLLLKNKFKSCEKKPKTDDECQSFKMNFCTAYTNFPCCSDILAGRTCSGKPATSMKRSYYNM